MKRLLQTSLILIAGIAIGWSSTWFYCGKELGNQIIDSSFAKIMDDVTILAMLRKESGLAVIEQKEHDLSDMLFGLSRIEHVDALSEKKMRYLRMAAGYREKYPFQSGDTDIDREVGDFLQTIRGKK